jgi:hypothetical protein
MEMRMPKKPKRPQLVKPTRETWRPWPGSSIRIVLTDGVPTPACVQHLIVKQKGA